MKNTKRGLALTPWLGGLVGGLAGSCLALFSSCGLNIDGLDFSPRDTAAITAPAATSRFWSANLSSGWSYLPPVVGPHGSVFAIDRWPSDDSVYFYDSTGNSTCTQDYGYLTLSVTGEYLAVSRGGTDALEVFNLRGENFPKTLQMRRYDQTGALISTVTSIATFGANIFQLIDLGNDQVLLLTMDGFLYQINDADLSIAAQSSASILDSPLLASWTAPEQVDPYTSVTKNLCGLCALPSGGYAVAAYYGSYNDEPYAYAEGSALIILNANLTVSSFHALGALFKDCQRIVASPSGRIYSYAECYTNSCMYQRLSGLSADYSKVETRLDFSSAETDVVGFNIVDGDLVVATIYGNTMVVQGYTP
jgi:hypothetical protein